MMNRTAAATSVEDGEAQQARSATAAAPRSGASALVRLAPITLALGPVLAVGCAAVLTIGDGSLSVPALLTFLGCVAAVSVAHRAWDARDPRR